MKDGDSERWEQKGDPTIVLAFCLERVSRLSIGREPKQNEPERELRWGQKPRRTRKLNPLRLNKGEKRVSHRESQSHERVTLESPWGHWAGCIRHAEQKKPEREERSFQFPLASPARANKTKP